MAKLKAILALENSGFCSDEVSAVKRRLQEVGATLVLWRTVQRDCLALGRVLFSSAERAAASPEFEDDFKRYARMMNEVIKKPLIADACLADERSAELEGFKSCFKAHLRRCSGLVEAAMEDFPRLKFLTHMDVVSLLGGRITNEGSFDECVVKALGNQDISSLVLEEQEGEEETEVSIVGVRNVDGEVLKFGRAVAIDECVPLDELLASLREEIQHSAKDYGLQVLSLREGLCGGREEAEERARRWCALLSQFAYLQHEAAFNDEVEAALRSADPQAGFKETYARITRFVAGVVDLMAAGAGERALKRMLPIRMRRKPEKIPEMAAAQRRREIRRVSR